MTFDFWDTLMTERPGSLREQRLAYWNETLGLSGPELEAAHDEAHKAHLKAWEENRQFRVQEAADMIVERLRDVDRDALVAGFDEGGRNGEITALPGARECLAMLKDAGMRIGIISDIGLTPSPILRERLDREGLLEFFDATTFSDEAGAYKPDPEIFRIAAESLGGVAPSEAAHIGDRRRTDVAGALAAGWLAVRFVGPRDHETATEPEGDIVVEHLAELPALLGVA